MSDALFLPRELFHPATPPSAESAPAKPPAQTRRGLHFTSGEAVAADLLKWLAPAGLPPVVMTWERSERRRRPRVGRSLA